MANPRLDNTPDNGDHESSSAPNSDDWRSSYRDVMAIREFRSVWLAHALSMIGTNLLNIATSVLVFQVTGSALAAGVTLALTFLPPIISPLIAGLADLFPRRRVMIACDITRAAVIVLIGIPGMPIWAIWILLFCSVVPSIPFAAARAAMMAEIVQGERYVASTAIIQLTSQVGMLAGLVAGGVIVSYVGPNVTVMSTGILFVLSAVVVLLGVKARPSPRAEKEDRPGFLAMTRDGAKLVFADPRLRTLALLAWLAGLYGIPYGLANPMAEESGAGPAAAGFIMAGSSIGAFVGGLVLTRIIPPPTRMRLLGPLAVFTCVPLLLWLADPPLWLMVTALALCGVAGSYQFVANAAFVLCVPQEGRGLAFGLVAAGLQAAQGVGILVAGFFAEHFGTGVVIASAGALGVVCATLLAIPWSRMAGQTIERMNATGSAP
ncbi:MFS transporter [Nocardiopsis sp. TSRI0078]|uniref:MFS transporter n=1 Tax=unclassified Nocardiopsis TaxID=2649073 RepID=UPI00093945B7|nr:MFS transporter [Nocardiopsis sp. TSRI0078]OKI23587.1 MFS transporter [Nocardiopsis sp. TSRI0078]